MDEIKISVGQAVKLGFGFGLGVILLAFVPALGIVLALISSGVLDWILAWQ